MVAYREVNTNNEVSVRVYIAPDGVLLCVKGVYIELSISDFRKFCINGLFLCELNE